MSVWAAGRGQVTLLRDLSRELHATDWRAVSLPTCSIRSTPFLTTVDSRRCLPRRLCADTWLGLLTRVWLGEFTPSLSRKFAIAQKRTVASTWSLAELLLLQSDMVCENIYICDGQFRDMSDFVTSLQATFDRKVTKLCESVKTQRRICKCNCKWKLPKDVKWRNL